MTVDDMTADNMTADNMAVDDRGSLEVRSRAVGRMAEIAAANVAGVERVSGGMTSRALPYADVSVRDGRIRATVEAATRWPTPIADVAARVRAGVEQDLARTSGLVVESVEVTMKYSAPVRDSTTTRRVE